MEKYLYLTKTEWQDPWLNGGSIPINLASTYLRSARGGVFTPDETVIHDSPVDLRTFPLPVRLGEGRGFTMTNCTWDGHRVPDLVKVSLYREDGNILSFCNIANKQIKLRLGKSCCVKILDVEALKSIIDEQLGIVGRMGPCQYTDGHQRDHFLKSMADLWQHEYRLFWLGQENKQVKLPPGIAVPVDV